ncbi:uncharacterized protein LOC126392679 [Epinephelus moara]|uniref:uncharacterized protein LOC126392679 n=1 Tax=Epinephelus moara TaxID=300413 RepID=UPI00214DF736|nr:uncharacterized protein LOC126392679 [Epinephelus moara]
MWFDKRITWKTHIEKVVGKCKKILNIIRCLKGRDWGAHRASLKTVYIGLIRSVLDYGCIVYESASKTMLKKLDSIQYQALRVCCGAKKTTPVSALQVEMGEMPLEIRREQISLIYWAHLRGHGENHPAQNILKPCQEKERRKVQSFGWTIENRVKESRIADKNMSKTVPLSIVPPWTLEEAIIDLRLLKKEKGKSVSVSEVNKYINRKYSQFIKVYTDASKSGQNRVGIAFVVPDLNIVLNKRVNDDLAIYTGELLAIHMALNWVHEVRPGKVLIASDSSSALVSIKHVQSDIRQDIIFEIAHILQGIKRAGVEIKFIWVPAHIGFEGNELADKYAKSATRKEQISMVVTYSKAEIKSIVKSEMKKKWQKQWDRESRGRHFYNIQRNVGEMRECHRSSKEEDIISRMRFGHTGLNSTLFIIQKHETGNCEHCESGETVEHILFQCPKYQTQRNTLKAAFKRNKIPFNVADILRRNSGDVVFGEIFRFLEATGLVKNF